MTSPLRALRDRAGKSFNDAAEAALENKYIGSAVGLAVSTFARATIAVDRFLHPGVYEEQEKARAELLRFRKQFDIVYRQGLENVVRHPAAAPQQEPLQVGEVLQTVSRVSSSLIRRGVQSLAVTPEGDIIADGKRHEGLALKEVQVAARVDEEKAKALWQWTYSLAATGEAPHLFPRLVAEQKDGALGLRVNPDHASPVYGGYQDQVSLLWRADLEKAMKSRRDAALKSSPFNRK